MFSKQLLCALILPCLFACGPQLNITTLSVAVVNQSYTENLAYEDSWYSVFDDVILTLSHGSLPPGVVLSAYGTIAGIPASVGNYEFRVTAYSIHNDFFDDDSVTEDSEWFTLFVTEASTNIDCPAPNDEGLEETYFCLGDISTETLAEGDSFTLDVNYYVNLWKAEDYNIHTINLSIIYDASLFTIESNRLNSTMLREAATRAGTAISFDTSIPGELRVTLQGNSKSYHKPGRLIDIPFTALQNITAGEYDFQIIVNDLVPKDSNKTLPAMTEIDGKLTVEENIAVENPAVITAFLNRPVS